MSLIFICSSEKQKPNFQNLKIGYPKSSLLQMILIISSTWHWCMHYTDTQVNCTYGYLLRNMLGDYFCFQDVHVDCTPPKV